MTADSRPPTTVNHSLACAHCNAAYPSRELINLCPACNGPILVQYDLTPNPALRDVIRNRAATMWRYAEVLPALDGDEVVTLGEGVTPLLPSNVLKTVWIKDE